MPYNVLNLEYGLELQPNTSIKNEMAEEVLRQTQQIHYQSHQSLTHSYVRRGHFYNRKASANPSVVNDYCNALHPKAHSQTTKLLFREWTGPYIVVKTLPNTNYIFRKLEIYLTKILLRIQQWPFTSSKRLPDITVQPKDFQQNSEVAIEHSGLYAMSWQETYEDYELPIAVN